LRLAMRQATVHTHASRTWTSPPSR
jgi:hypothetical protein